MLLDLARGAGAVWPGRAFGSASRGRADYADVMANFYTDSHGADVEALRAAMRQLRTQATQGTAGVFFMAKTDVKSSALGGLLGQQVIKSLEKNGNATVPGLNLMLLTARDGKAPRFPGPVLALHVTADALRKLGGAPSDIIFVPWMKEELAAVLAAGEKWTKIYDENDAAQSAES